MCFGLHISVISTHTTRFRVYLVLHESMIELYDAFLPLFGTSMEGHALSWCGTKHYHDASSMS